MSKWDDSRHPVRDATGDDWTGSAALNRWYEAYMTADVDDFGRSAARFLSLSELDEAIEVLAARVAMGRYGMSGSQDLKVLRSERDRKGIYS